MPEIDYNAMSDDELFMMACNEFKPRTKAVDMEYSEVAEHEDYNQ